MKFLDAIGVKSTLRSMQISPRDVSRSTAMDEAEKRVASREDSVDFVPRFVASYYAGR